LEATQAGISAALDLLSETNLFILRAAGALSFVAQNSPAHAWTPMSGRNLELNWK
jgi:hypothetical protein